VADAIVNVEFVPGLGLPYAAGAEAAFAPEDAAAFAGVSAIAGTPLTLVPGFDLPIDELADFLAAARQGGVEPPDLFAWYALTCPDVVADAVVVALTALPFVVQASIQAQQALARWEVVTDPNTLFQRQLRMPPAGINAFAAWQVPGGSGRGARVADVEHGWDLQHADFQHANITTLTLLPAVRQKDVDHGTASLGIVGAQTNGTGVVGIAPGAAFAVAHAGSHPGATIAIAARHVGRGGIVLLELGEAIPERVHEDTAHIPLEHDPQIKAAIIAATALGVLVVEPAGNGSVNLDSDARYPDLRSPPNSGALMVGAAESQVDADGDPTNVWMPASFTTGGARVNCFAAGERVAAPKTGVPGGATFAFGGTSAASAIIAGVAAALQGVVIAAHGLPLPNTDLHARLSDPQFGRPPDAASPTNPQSIGVTPDLEKLLEGVSVPRVAPLTAARATGDRVVVMRPRRRDIMQLEILEGPDETGAWIQTATSGDAKGVAIGHPAALYVRTDAGATRVDAVTPDQRSGVCHRPFVLDAGVGINEPWRLIALPDSDEEMFKASSPMTVAARGTRVLVAGLGIDDRLLVLNAERMGITMELVPTTTVSDETTGLEPMFERPDALGRYHCPPVIFRYGMSVGLVGVDTDGWIRYAEWSLAIGWSDVEFVQQGLDPGNPPAIATDGAALHVVGFESASRELREVVRSADADGLFQWTAMRAIATPPLVTWGMPLEPATAITMASDGAGRLMIMGLNVLGFPMWSVRLPGFDWSPLLFAPTLTAFIERGGLALASPSPGVFVATAADSSGALHWARWTVLGWSPFVPV
jgi:hypothetical protein